MQLVYTVKVILGFRLKLYYGFRLKVKVIIKMIHLFFSCRTTAADGNTRKQNSKCMNTVLQNMNGNWKLLL